MAQELVDATSLREFRLERVLNEDPSTHSIALLGTFPLISPTDYAVVRVEGTAFPASSAPLLANDLSRAERLGNTDIYSWFMGWLSPESERAHVKINIIYPATEVHVRKYSRQRVVMVHETPEIYEKIVKPYIESFPRARIQWVYDILSGAAEADKVLYKDTDPEYGYVLLPDMKWDQVTEGSLYLVAIALSADIRSLRDLRKKHVGLLKNIRAEAGRVVQEKWGMGPGSLRMFIHYQPSYYHFHVHIVNVNYSEGLTGMAVGQAHLLDDIISLLELDSDDTSSILSRMTLTYSLGERHGLYEQLLGLGL